MKVLLASEYFYPISKGGTEMYVLQLAKELIKKGHECIVLSLSNDKQREQYEGIPIVYAHFIEHISSEQENPDNYDVIYKLVKEINPDVFHLHSLSPSLGTSHLVKLKQEGIKTVFTAHITNFTCVRGDLMRYGKEVCDGFVDKKRCMDCYFHSKGYESNFSRNLLNILAALPYSYLANKGFGVVANKMNDLQKLQNGLDHLVLVSEWQKRIIELNQYNFKQTSVCRQAVPDQIILREKINKVRDKVNIGFVGRIVRVKGLHYLLNALSNTNIDTVNLHIAAIKSNNEQEYYTLMKEEANRLQANWIENLSAEEVIRFLDKIDLLVVPSMWLETGPFVIYEALARRIPVIAFNRGGAVELIKNNVNGWLVNTQEELNEKLTELINNPTQLIDASNSIVLNRTTEQLYEETMAVYTRTLLNEVN